jgi:hypothetical protein
MSSLEAVWTIRFGWSATRRQDWEGGVVALFSNRLVGGDSVMAYVGNYESDGDQIRGRMTIMRHNYPEGSKADYEDQELRFEVAFEGTRSNDEITGHLRQRDRPDANFTMRKFAPLPETNATNIPLN